MPYIIAIVVVILGAVAFFIFRTPAEAPTIEPNMVLPEAPTPGIAPEGFTPPTTPPPGTEEGDVTPTVEELVPVDGDETSETEVNAVETDFDPADDQRTYTADASYLTPRRTEHEILVSLTLKDRVVVDANVTYDGGAASSPSHSSFDAAYQSEVIGKSLNEISLSRVGGASLTSTAFNEAVAEIRSKRS